MKAARGCWTEPSRQPAGEYLATWLAGLRLAPSTVASHEKNIRPHIVPYIGAVPLTSLASARLTALYRELEASGRRDRDGERTGLPLSPRTGQLNGEYAARTGAALLRADAILDPAAPPAGPGVDRAQAPCQGKLLGCTPGTDEAGTIRRDHGGLNDAVHKHDDSAARISGHMHSEDTDRTAMCRPGGVRSAC